MTFSEYKDALFEAAKKAGCDAAEIYSVCGDEFMANVLEGEVEDYKASKSEFINLRIKIGGKDGYAYTEAYEDAEALVRHAIDTAKSIESTDESPMCGKEEYEDIIGSSSKLEKIPAKERIELAKRIEIAVKAQDERVQRLAACQIICATSTVRIYNTEGLEAEFTSGNDIAVIAPIMSIGGESVNHYEFAVGDELCDVHKLAQTAVDNCIRKSGGTPMTAGEYKVLIENAAMIDLLSCFTGVFSADAAQKGMSLFAGKEGEAVAAACVSIYDDPTVKYSESKFDGEGTPVHTKALIENGVLKTLLHNNKTAKKAGITSTGNASRSVGPIGVSPTNLRIEAGELSYEQMIEKLGDGLIIIELGNIGSGSSEISGDFSFSAKGLLVENGKVVRKVDKVTVAGSFFEVLKNIVATGSDLRGVPAMLYDGIGYSTPSVLISKLMVAGDA